MSDMEHDTRNEHLPMNAENWYFPSWICPDAIFDQFLLNFTRKKSLKIPKG